MKVPINGYYGQKRGESPIETSVRHCRALDNLILNNMPFNAFKAESIVLISEDGIKEIDPKDYYIS